MDKVRYFLAMWLLVFVPPAFLFWFSIHPFIRFWRRLGPRLALAIHYPAMLALAGLIYLLHKPLLSVDFGTSPLLIALAIPFLVVSSILRLRISKYLRIGILTGIPELAPEQHHTPLLKEGIYARVRHPRYVQFMLALAGWSLICNYLATYLLLAVLALILRWLVRIEESELRDRFGAEYEDYCNRVPRFIPRLRS